MSPGRLVLLQEADRLGWDTEAGVELRRQAKDLFVPYSDGQ